MLKSMTGFGKAQAEGDGILVEVEAKSLNHKYLEINVRLPRQFSFLEPHIRALVQKTIARGRIDLYIQVKLDGLKGKKIEINRELAKLLWREIKGLCSDLSCPLPTLSAIIREVLTVEEEVPEEEIREVVLRAVNDALERLLTFRCEEGERLKVDILKRIAKLDEFVEKAESIAQISVEETKRKLEERLKELSIDDNRIAQEIALMVERMDVTEELVRLKSHIEAFIKTVEEGSPCGRKLDFLTQEMLREANTLGVKAAVAQLTHIAVNLKTEIEKIREQVQNIE